MADSVLSLADQWANISLDEEEEFALDCPIQEGSFEDSHDKYTVVGRFLTDKNINFGTMRQVLASLWRPVKGVSIREGSKDVYPPRFIFKFFHEQDLKRIMDTGPWTFNNHLLILHRLSVSELPMQVDLNMANFWVQIHEVPVGYMSERISIDIGNYLGIFIEIDPKNFDGGWRNYMRVRVAIDIRKPIKRRMKIRKQGEDYCWVYFRYERLPTFCFYCGLIGHTEKFCVKLFDNPNAGSDRAYGPSLRASNRR